MENSTEREIINGLISYEENNSSWAGSDAFDDACRKSVENRLQQVNAELERYTVRADTLDYTIAIASGIIAGVIDSVFTGEFSLEKAHKWGSEKTEQFVLKVANERKLRKAKEANRPKKPDLYTDVNKAIEYLAEGAPHRHSHMKKGYHVVSDTLTGVLGGTNQHHLWDFSHHASILGLMFSILTQFTKKCYGTDVTGAFRVVCVKKEDLIYIGNDVPEKLLFGIVYWFFHLVSDVAGSGDPRSEGTGIPGPILSTAKLLASTPLFAFAKDERGNREFSAFVSKLFNGTYLGKRDENGRLIPLRFDFRTELGLGNMAVKQAFPVMLNEVCVRTFYMLRRFTDEVLEKSASGFSDLENLNWDAIKPWGNRTVERMVTVASVTFSFADTADAAVHAALESGGNWVIFSGRFFARINYIGAGRAVLAVVKEVSSDIREAQLLKERRMLMETEAEITFEQLQLFKEELEEKLSMYLAEDIQTFIEGFDYINEGLETGDSDLVIKGNVVIQKVLGREPQFTNQQEFESMMESDVPFIF